MMRESYNLDMLQRGQQAPGLGANRLQLRFATEDEARFHRHIGQDESALVVSGGAVYNLDGAGAIQLGDYHSGLPFYARVFGDTVHQLSIKGITQRVAPGPLMRDLTIMEHTPVGHVGAAPGMLNMIRTGEEAFYTTDNPVVVGQREIDILKQTLPTTARRRIRLCCHRNNLEPLHEMFVLYTNATMVQPNKHIAKDETFHILEGEADFVFYSDAGDVTEIIPLGPKESGRKFFVRVPAGVYHTVVMTSELLVIHESTPGPYIREETVWAPWTMNYLKGQAYADR